MGLEGVFRGSELSHLNAILQDSQEWLIAHMISSPCGIQRGRVKLGSDSCLVYEATIAVSSTTLALRLETAEIV